MNKILPTKKKKKKKMSAPVQLYGFRTSLPKMYHFCMRIILI